MKIFLIEKQPSFRKIILTYHPNIASKKITSVTRRAFNKEKKIRMFCSKWKKMKSRSEKIQSVSWLKSDRKKNNLFKKHNFLPFVHSTSFLSRFLDMKFFLFCLNINSFMYWTDNTTSSSYLDVLMGLSPIMVHNWKLHVLIDICSRILHFSTHLIL